MIHQGVLDRAGKTAAAHLKAKGLDVYSFGQANEFGPERMPAGMLLRSPREACDLYRQTLVAYETARDLSALALETFVTYGRRFRQHLRIADDLTVWQK